MSARDPILKLVTDWQEQIPNQEESLRLSFILEN